MTALESHVGDHPESLLLPTFRPATGCRNPRKGRSVAMSPAFLPASKIISSKCATCAKTRSLASPETRGARPRGSESTPAKLERKRERDARYIEEPDAERTDPSRTVKAHDTQ